MSKERPGHERKGTSTMAKQKKQKKPTLAAAPGNWDKGATGPANRAGLRSEPVMWTNDKGERVNPNGVKRMRRVDMFDKYGRDNTLTPRQFDAGTKLRDAWLRTIPSGGSDMSDPIVDRTPQYGTAVIASIDRISALVAISKHIPESERDLIEAVVYEGRPVGHVKRYKYSRTPKGKDNLRQALDAVADGLGMG